LGLRNPDLGTVRGKSQTFHIPTELVEEVRSKRAADLAIGG